MISFNDAKVLIAYFSRPGNNYVGGNIIDLPIGNTEVAAKVIKNIINGELFKIDPVKKYSNDYSACTDEAKQELRANARPELIAYPDRIDQYDTIILGYPNWWGTMPMPVFTFLEKYDFNGKTIFPFCTHEGSAMGNSESDIKKLCPGSKVLKGLPIRGGNVNHAEKEIASWLEKANID